MIVSCPSCRARFLFKRSAFSEAPRRRAKCIKCDTAFIIGPLPAFIPNSRAKALKSQRAAHKQPPRQPHTEETCSNKRKRVWTLASLLTLALLLAGFYFYKASIANHSQKPLPSLALTELANRTVLEIKNLELGWKTTENTIQLSIQGDLSNPSNIRAKSTGVTITLLDENDMPVLVWDYEIPERVIPPGQHIRFHTSTDDPPANAISVMVRLTSSPMFSK